MSYYKTMGLTEEPFSNSPDPAFFYESFGHREALLRLEIAIKLKRGLSVILGDVGTGKTTLARRLVNAFSDKQNFEFGIILDPTSSTEDEFIASVISAFGIKLESQAAGFSLKKAVEQYLFQKGVDENKTVILLVDEAQKLHPHAIEALRMLLNYETNKFKLLQLVLLGQTELLPQIRQVKNFWDRIALKYVINPLNQEETRQLIDYRLKIAGYCRPFPLFDQGAMEAVYNFTQGCPRKICHLCHDALEMLVIRRNETVTRTIIQDLVAEELKISKL